MVNLKHILNRRNCPTLDHQLYDDIEATMEYREQGYRDFPPRDHLFDWEEDPDVYRENSVLKNLFEIYQPFFEKGIDYSSDGKTWNVYPTGSMLWYCNEAFSLCTKLSIDPCPEEYFIDEYYRDIGGGCTQIERYFVLSIVYALLAVNWKVRRQHLKMIDVLYNFLSTRCPIVVMTKCIGFIAKTYSDNNAIDYEFRPVIDRFGYTLLKVDEGLVDDEEEQRDLITQMRKKVCENGIEYGKKFNAKPDNDKEEKRKAIMEYVGRLKPDVDEKYATVYDEMWQKILEKESVKSEVYDKGKQQKTIFNRNLVANIIKLMNDNGVFKLGTNPTSLVRLLEPEEGEKHSVRGSLGSSPGNKSIKADVESVINEFKSKINQEEECQ